ncbi:MAG: hypothetical protein ABIZ91_13710 [Gemmatimonadaceae bacterium]
MKLTRRSFLVLAVATLGAACAGRTQPRSGGTQGAELQVENQAFNDATIYLVTGSQRIRLGQANGNSTTKLRIPSHYIFGPTPLQFIADPIGGNRTPVSESITVTAGDVVVLRIPPS